MVYGWRSAHYVREGGCLYEMNCSLSSFDCVAVQYTFPGCTSRYRIIINGCFCVLHCSLPALTVHCGTVYLSEATVQQNSTGIVLGKRLHLGTLFVSANRLTFSLHLIK